VRATSQRSGERELAKCRIHARYGLHTAALAVGGGRQQYRDPGTTTDYCAPKLLRIVAVDFAHFPPARPLGLHADWFSKGVAY
jgi:hypothetical protein